jgi:hypothetical protein
LEALDVLGPFDDGHVVPPYVGEDARLTTS